MYIYMCVLNVRPRRGTREGGRGLGDEKERGRALPYLEQFSKIGAASGKYDAVRFEASAIAGQCDVHKILIVPQVLKCRRYTALVIVPSQTKVLRIYHRYIYSPTIRKEKQVRYTVQTGGNLTLILSHAQVN